MDKWNQFGAENPEDSVILGLSFSHHDGSACLVKGGEILCAIELERLPKVKKLAFEDDPK